MLKVWASSSTTSLWFPLPLTTQIILNGKPMALIFHSANSDFVFGFWSIKKNFLKSVTFLPKSFFNYLRNFVSLSEDPSKFNFPRLHSQSLNLKSDFNFMSQSAFQNLKFLTFQPKVNDVAVIKSYIFYVVIFCSKSQITEFKMMLRQINNGQSCFQRREGGPT